jgi:hypothetical protein
VTWTRTLSASIHRAGIQDATTKAILSSLVLGRFDELISHASDTDWRDLLALLLLQGTYADIVTGCTRLAERLHSHDTTAALVCALCAGDVPLATRLWMEAGFRGYELLERMLILRQALGFGAPSGAATAVPLAAEALQVVEQIATALVERGAVQLASAFLQELGVDGELTDRVKQFLGYAASGFDKQSRQPGASQRPVWTAAMQAAPHMSSAAKPPQLTFTSTSTRRSRSEYPQRRYAPGSERVLAAGHCPDDSTACRHEGPAAGCSNLSGSNSRHGLVVGALEILRDARDVDEAARCRASADSVRAERWSVVCRMAAEQAPPGDERISDLAYRWRYRWRRGKASGSCSSSRAAHANQQSAGGKHVPGRSLERCILASDECLGQRRQSWRHVRPGGRRRQYAGRAKTGSIDAPTHLR